MVEYDKIKSSDKYIMQWKVLNNVFIRNATMEFLFLELPQSIQISLCDV